MKPFALITAKSLEEASREAARPRTLLKAGGVDVLDRMKEGLDSPERVVSISRVPGLDKIEPGSPTRIGALVTLARIAEHPELSRSYPALAAAAAGAATPQIRNMATLGGNICQRPRCWYYRHQEFDCRKKGGADCYALEGQNRFHAIYDTDTTLCCCVHPSATGTALTAYGATVETVGAKGGRRLPIESLWWNPTEDPTRENTLLPGEIVQAVTIPAPAAGARSAYTKLKEKQSFDWPLIEACVAFSLEAGAIRGARVVLGSVAPIPKRFPEVEKMLEGQRPTPQLAARAGEAVVAGATPLSGNVYKVRLARVTLERTLRKAWA
ncbi:MAG TPA: FAD binding domain-containing protein [Thermoanaerobaculia bacterium]